MKAHFTSNTFVGNKVLSFLLLDELPGFSASLFPILYPMFTSDRKLFDYITPFCLKMTKDSLRRTHDDLFVMHIQADQVTIPSTSHMTVTFNVFKTISLKLGVLFHHNQDGKEYQDEEKGTKYFPYALIKFIEPVKKKFCVTIFRHCRYF